MNRIKAHWDEQASKGKLSGSRDRIAKELEIRAIAKYVRDEMRVLDVGCGDGETLRFLTTEFAISAVGIDYSQEMINQAVSMMMGSAAPYDRSLNYWVQDIKSITENQFLKDNPFDLIYTQRCLINLESWDEQRQAIVDIASLLKPGGKYLMVENTVEGLDEINRLRKAVDLPPIAPPWHNRYLNISCELIPFAQKPDCPLVVDDVVPFRGHYDFLSRVVNAKLAQMEGKEPDYESPINKLALDLPTWCAGLKGQSRLRVWRKK